MRYNRCMSNAKLTPEDVKHLAKLSALELTDKEIDLYTEQFGETLKYVENMQEMDTSGVSAAEHMSGQKNVFFADGTPNERQFTPEEATANSHKHKKGSFIVDRIL